MGGEWGYVPAHSIGLDLKAWDVLTIHIPDDILDLILQALWYVLTPRTLSDWCRWDGDILLRGGVVGHIREADFTVEFQTTIGRTGDALS